VSSDGSVIAACARSTKSTVTPIGSAIPAAVPNRNSAGGKCAAPATMLMRQNEATGRIRSAATDHRGHDMQEHRLAVLARAEPVRAAFVLVGRAEVGLQPAIEIRVVKMIMAQQRRADDGGERGRLLVLRLRVRGPGECQRRRQRERNGPPPREGQSLDSHARLAAIFAFTEAGSAS